MPHFIIFPRSTPGAMLQHSGESADADSAFAEFQSNAGQVERADYAVIEVTPEQAAEVEAWDDDGADAAEAPAWLDAAIRDEEA